MPKRILEGDVVSDKMDKTVTVLVERRFAHPVYKKYVKRTDKYAAHDENNAFGVGDRVQIEECKPISRRKTWTVITAPSAGSGRAKALVEAGDDVDTGRKSSKKKDVKKTAKAAPKEDKETVSKETASKETVGAEEKKAAPKKTTKKATSKKKDESK